MINEYDHMHYITVKDQYLFVSEYKKLVLDLQTNKTSILLCEVSDERPATSLFIDNNKMMSIDYSYTIRFVI